MQPARPRLGPIAPAIGPPVLLGWLGLALLAGCGPEGPACVRGCTVARFDLDGSGATFATTYTLRSDRVLESRRYSPSGGYDERRRLALDRLEYERYRSVLRAGGYFGAEPEDLPRPEVQRLLGAIVDLPDWTVTVRRSPCAVLRVRVPAEYVARYHPSLSTIPYVEAAWRLLGEFERSWDRSERVTGRAARR